MMGIITALLSSIRDIAYSLFQKYNARSATYENKKKICERIKFYDVKNKSMKILYLPENVGWKHTWQFA